MFLLNLKNVRYKAIVFFGVMILVFCVLIKGEKLDALQAFRNVFGGNELFRPIAIISFIIYVVLIQFMHIDSIMLILRNDTYLRVRYNTKKVLFNKILWMIFLVNILCVIIMFISWRISTVLCGCNLELINWKQLIEICFRGFLTSNILIIIQSISLIKRNETDTFFIMNMVSILLVLLSFTNLKVLSICPFYLEYGGLVFNVGLCIMYMMICILIYRKLYMEREHEQYGN